MTRCACNDLTFTIKATGESVTLHEQYNRANFQANAIERFIFSDQEILYTDLNPEDVDLVGTDAGEALYGTDFDETIDARGGDDVIFGASGGDRYKFDIGYGHDTIFDRQANATWGGDDIVLLGSDVTRQNIRFAAAGTDLIVSFADHSDTLVIQQQFGAANMGVEKFQFSDGVIWTIDNVRQLLSMSGGTLGDDELRGFSDQPNVLDGRQGNDTLHGANRADTYAFDGSYGSDVIHEAPDLASEGEDRVVFGELVTPDNLVVRKEGNDIVFWIAGTTDQLRIVEGLTTRRVERFLFADQTVWTLRDAAAGFLLSTDGDDVLFGLDDTDVVDGGRGSDRLEGGLGDDSYKFDLGYGADAIFDAGGGADKIVFGSMIAPSMIEFHADGGTLVIRIKGHDDSLAIIDGLAKASSRIEKLVFSNGTSLGFDEVRARLLQQLKTDSDDIVIGYADLADTLSGGAGYDLLSGLAGDDRYQYRAGDGFDIIDDRGGSRADRLEFVDHLSTDAVLRRATPASSDLLVIFSGADRVLIKDGLISGAASAIEELSFADNVIWSIADLRERALAQGGGPDNDYLLGFDTDDKLAGKAGNDVLDGGRGADRYSFSRGDGADIVNDTGATSETDVLEIRGYRPDQLRIIRPFPDRNDLQIWFEDTDDLVTLKNQVATTAGQGVERIEFGDGTVWTRAEIIARLPQGGNETSETITGTNKADVLIGRGGDDFPSGDYGADSYIFNRGDGRDYIVDDNWESGDVLEIGGYASSEALLSRFNDDLIIRFSGTGDEIRLKGTLDGGTTYGVDRVKFQDGVSWDRAALRQKVFAVATSGADVVIGSDASETLSGGGGDDRLSGGYGADSYIFNRGDGRDYIVNDDYWKSGDVLEIGGYASSEALLSRFNDDLIIRFSGTGDEIRLEGTLDGGNAYGVDRVKFQDGVSWDRAALRQKVVAVATSGADVVIGSDASETLSGGGGDDRLYGGYDADRYIFNRGDGRDYIVDNHWESGDVLEIGGYASSEALLSRFNDDLIIRFSGTGDEIRLEDTLDGGNAYGVDRVKFQDGVIWDRAALRQKVVAVATSGADVVIGSGASETLSGGGGDDRLYGGYGADRYIFNRGDGRDYIVDNHWESGDVLEIGGYASSEALLSRFNNDLIIRFSGTGDEIRLEDTLDGGAPYGVDRVKFQDGVSWDRATLRSLAATPATIPGASQADMLHGGAGDQRLEGGGGDDTYIFARGDGHDTIIDEIYWGFDTLRLQGYGASETTATRQGDDVILRFADATDSVTLAASLTNGSSYGVDRILFDDGTVWTMADVRRMVIERAFTDGADWIDGTGNPQTLTGGKGNDTLLGYGGDDIYVYARGDGHDTIIEESFSGVDTLRLQGYSASETTATRQGDDVILRFGDATDSVTLAASLTNGNSAGVDRILFDDGTVWTMADVRRIVIERAFTDGADRIDGTGNPQTLAGGKGNDTLLGYGGDDIYVYARGDGHDTIIEESFSGVDTLRLQGYGASETTATRQGDDVILRFADATDSVTFAASLTNGNSAGVDRILFDDGTAWTMADVRRMVIERASTDGADRIDGTSHPQTLAGGGMTRSSAMAATTFMSMRAATVTTRSSKKAPRASTRCACKAMARRKPPPRGRATTSSCGSPMRPTA